jgi:hypothetical protein
MIFFFVSLGFCFFFSCEPKRKNAISSAMSNVLHCACVGTPITGFDVDDQRAATVWNSIMGINSAVSRFHFVLHYERAQI